MLSFRNHISRVKSFRTISETDIFSDVLAETTLQVRCAQLRAEALNNFAIRIYITDRHGSPVDVTARRCHERMIANNERTVQHREHSVVQSVRKMDQPNPCLLQFVVCITNETGRCWSLTAFGRLTPADVMSSCSTENKGRQRRQHYNLGVVYCYRTFWVPKRGQRDGDPE